MASLFHGVTPASLLLFQVYLEARKQEQHKHQQSLKMLSDEVSQIQEVSFWTGQYLRLSSDCLTPTGTHANARLSLDYITICMFALCKFLPRLFQTCSSSLPDSRDRDWNTQTLKYYILYDDTSVTQGLYFHTGEVLPEDTEGADGSQKQGRSILSCSPLFTLYPVLSSAALVSTFHSFLADFLLFFFFQPLTNGWKVSVPFRKSSSSAPKAGAKTDAQVSRISRARPSFRSCLYTIESMSHFSGRCMYQIVAGVCVLLWTMCAGVWRT